MVYVYDYYKSNVVKICAGAPVKTGVLENEGGIERKMCSNNLGKPKQWN